MLFSSKPRSSNPSAAINSSIFTYNCEEEAFAIDLIVPFHNHLGRRQDYQVQIDNATVVARDTSGVCDCRDRFAVVGFQFAYGVCLRCSHH